MKSFLARFGALVLAVLTGFDRLRFRADSRLLNHTRGVHSYLWQQQILHKDFPVHAQHLTDRLRRQTEADAQTAGVPLKHLDSPTLDKEACARDLARQHQRAHGRLALLTCVESCQIYRPRLNPQGLLELRKQPGKCVHYYHYFNDPQVGFGYVRVQSWFPFTVHLGLNGRTWLYQQLRQHGHACRHRDNLLAAVDDWPRAQALLDEQLHTDWPALLDRLTAPCQPLWDYLRDVTRVPYYWMTEQSEWATDVLFRDPRDLALWYPRWLRHGIEGLSCKDVMRFLGRQVPEQGYGPCAGDATADLRERPEGVRRKMWYRHNALKMYDKAGQALRVETTINQPGDFRVYRTPEGAAEGTAKSWQQMRKGVADLGRRGAVSGRVNERLLESLAGVKEPTPLGKLFEPLSQPVVTAGGRRARGLHVWGEADGKLLRVIARGDFLLQGFRNRDVREALYGTVSDRGEQRRQAAAVTRRRALLRAHGLIVKVQKTHRYPLSALGRRVTTALATASAADVCRLTEAA
jgi:hypothetical protein